MCEVVCRCVRRCGVCWCVRRCGVEVCEEVWCGGVCKGRVSINSGLRLTVDST